MAPKSLALKTDLIFNRFSGDVIDRGEYLVVRTPSRPNYFWGNYLIMSGPPGAGDLERWISLFEKEIGAIEKRGFIALTWDSTNGDQGTIQPFIDYGFAINKSTILTARSVCPPPKFNPDIVVRPLQSNEDWESYIDIHFSPDWGYGEESQVPFLKNERDHLRAMVDNGLGLRFGAELGGRLVGEAGIYWEDKIARFSNVGTHRDFRRQGVCGTLIHSMSTHAFKEEGIQTLVMEADDDYHAALIYESVGFTPTEKLIALEWYDQSRF